MPPASGCAVVSDRDGLRSIARCNVMRPWLSSDLGRLRSRSCRPGVPMMKTADARQGPRLAWFGRAWLNRPARRRRLLQADVRAVFLVMYEILLQCSPQRRFSKQDQPRQTFFFDRSHPAFRIRVQIRARCWQSKRIHTSRPDQFSKRFAELRVTAMQQIAAASQASPAIPSRVEPLRLSQPLSQLRTHNWAIVCEIGSHAESRFPRRSRKRRSCRTSRPE